LYKNAAFLETDLIARLEFFDYERILHRSKRKKYKKMATILYQSFVFSSKKGRGAGQGISWQKKFGTKKNSDWNTLALD